MNEQRKLKGLNEDQCGLTEETGMERTQYGMGWKGG